MGLLKKENKNTLVDLSEEMYMTSLLGNLRTLELIEINYTSILVRWHVLLV